MSQIPDLKDLLPFSSESDLQDFSKDELKSTVAQVNQRIKTLQNSNSEAIVIRFLVEAVKAAPSDLEKATAKDLRSYLIGLLKLIDTQGVFALSDVKAMDQSTLGAELNNIDFYKLIGGPLNAVVQAQANAALTTVSFIKSIGFENMDEAGNVSGLRTVRFSYNKTTPPSSPDGQPTTTETQIEVPILAMVSIPSLRIQDVDISFNAKINGVEEMKDEKTFKGGIDIGAKFGPVNIKATASYQRTTTMGSRVEREYTMAVKVKATQDEMPAGLEKLLTLLSA